MASEAHVVDQTPDKHVEEKEVITANTPKDQASQYVAEVKDEHDGKGETDPLVEKKKNEIAKDSAQEIPSVSSIEEKLDAPNAAEPSDKAAEVLSEKPSTDSAEVSNQETKNLSKDADLVQSVPEGDKLEKNNDVPTEYAKNNTILPEEPEIVVEKTADVQSVVTATLASDVVEPPISKNPEARISEVVKEATSLLIKEKESTVAEVGKMDSDIHILETKDKVVDVLESGADSVEILATFKDVDVLESNGIAFEKSIGNHPSETHVEKLSELSKSVLGEVGSSEKHDENVVGEDATPGFIPLHEETLTTVAVDSESVVKGDAIIAKVASLEDTSPETKVHVHSEVDSSQTIEGEKIPEVTEKFDPADASAVRSLLPESSDTDNVTGKIEGLENNDCAVEHVIPVAIASIKDGGLESEKEVSSFLDKATAAIEASTKEVVVDPPAVPSVTVEEGTAAVGAVIDLPEVHAASERESKIEVALDSVKPVVKEVVGGNEEASDATEVAVTEVVAIEKICEEKTTQTSVSEVVEVAQVVDISDASKEQVTATGLVGGDTKTPDDGIEKVETIVKEVVEGNVAEKPVEEKKDESKKACEGTDLKKDGNIESHARDLAGLLKDTADPKPEAEAPKQEVPTKTRSPGVISKVKHTLLKARKAIFGKSPSSKTIESKGEGKA